MDDEDFGADREPLLVRPFVVQDDEPGEQPSSDATWPGSAAADSPTQVLPVFSGAGPVKPRRGRRKRRPLLVAGVGAGVLVLVAAGYTALRPSFEPALSADLPDHPLPAVTGPAVASAPASADADAAGGVTGGGQGSEPDYGNDDEQDAKATTAAATPTTAQASVSPGAQVSASVAGSVAPNPPAALVPSPPMAGTGALVSGNGLCLDVPNAIPTDDNSIQVFDCNRTVAQVWTLADDGTLRVMGRCALITGDDTVHLTGCDGRTTAQWRVTGAREVVNAANSACLTDPSGGGRPGTRVTVIKCTGQSNQQWALR